MSEYTQNYPSPGTWIRQRRKALDLTQAALAHQVGCATVTIRKLEADIARPSRGIAKRLAACLKLPPKEHDLFLQVARGERPVDRLPTAHPADTDLLPATGQIPLPPLPLEIVPPPAPLPPGSRMPLSRNPLFVGRDADLRQLARALTVSETAAIRQVEIAAATGLGGIGKTQLACEFVHRYGQFFPGGVFWLSFADPAAIPAEVAACGGDRGMRLHAAFDQLRLDKQVQLVQAAWETPISRLLVFDNCEDEALLDAWRPKHGSCRILVTSRRRYWDPALGVQPVPLDVLLRSDSLALLHQFRPDLPAQDVHLHAIAETLGDLPLALHLAGSFLAKYRHAITPAQYWARLHAPTLLDDRSLHTAGLSPTQHVQHVARTFEQSYARLDPTDSTDVLARTLLDHAAYCAPGEPVPRWFLLQTLDLPETDAAGVLHAEDALTRLIDLGLLDTDAVGSLRMHRLVVAFVRAVLAHDEAHAAVEATMLRVADDVNERGNPYPLLVVQPHLRCLTEAAQPRADARAAALCTALGYHLWHLGVYREAQGYHERACAIRQQVLGMDHLDTATSLNNLGLVLQAQGQYAVAQDYYAQALAIRQRVLGPDHPETASSLNNVGLALYNQGQYGEAHRSLEQALGIRQRVQGDQHFDTATTLNNLGLLGLDLGQYAEAQSYFEQALAIRQQVLGANHPQTAMSLNNLAGVLALQGQYLESQRSLEQALAIQQHMLGADHPETAMSLGNLGELLTVQGHYAEARGYFEQALAIFQRALGLEHPDIARVLRALGEVLHAQGDAMQARGYLEQALTIFLERLGPQHLDTERTRQLLARLDAESAAAERGS